MIKQPVSLVLASVLAILITSLHPLAATNDDTPDPDAHGSKRMSPVISSLQAAINSDPDDAFQSLVPPQQRHLWTPTQLGPSESTATTNTIYSIPPNIQVSHSGVISGASQLVTDFSEVMVALDPTDPDHLLGCSKFFFDSPNYGFYTGLLESYDGGFTWTQFQPTDAENYDYTSDPVTTFDDQGNGYFSLLTREWIASDFHTGIDVVKKPVGGSWEPTVLVDDTTYTDKQWITGDQDPQGTSPHAGNLYMSWVDLEGTWRIMFARSTNSNSSWSSPPLELTSGDVQAPVPGVAPDGTVYVTYLQGSVVGSGPGTIDFAKSTNGGASFTTPATAASITTIPYTLPQSTFRTPGSFPAFAVSPVDGNLYLTWADYRHGDADIYFTRSTNGGVSWGTPIRLNDDTIGNDIDQWQPQVSVAPDGRVAVMWFDRRLDCPDLDWIPPDHVGQSNFCIDTYMTRSYDEGQSWVPNFRVSEQTWDWTLNLPITQSGYGFIGDYQGLASNEDFDFPFWNATADLGENPNNYQQVFVARVPTPFINLEAAKSVEPSVIRPGQTLTYTVVISNSGPDDAAAVSLTDTLPSDVNYVSNSLSYPPGLGTGEYRSASRTIVWNGPVSRDTPVTITFQATARTGLAEGVVIQNTATINDGAGAEIDRTATATVTAPPFIVDTSPQDGIAGVAVAAPLIITFSEPMNTSSLQYSVSPDPGGWSLDWSPDRRMLTMNHSDWSVPQTYSVTINARDDSNESLVAGPVPNPWSFTTREAPLITATYPSAGATDVSIFSSLVVTFSEPMDTNSLTYTVAPDPGGWAITWDGSDQVAVLKPSVWKGAQTHVVTITANNKQGFHLEAGPVPNPWSFSTESLFRLQMPLVLSMYRP